MSVRWMVSRAGRESNHWIPLKGFRYSTSLPPLSLALARPNMEAVRGKRFPLGQRFPL